MCGIIGEISDSQIDRRQFISLRDTLSHRGPDGAGLELFNGKTTALGHRRLAIIDPSDDGLQPMCNEDRTVWLVFNGEIYNFQTLRDDLIDCGHEFKSETDSEVIIHGYEEWGEDCVKKINGMFSFGIWDSRKNKTFIARDRIGIKPLYYFEDDERFLFASEPKAIISHDQVEKNIDSDGLALYLKHRYVPAPKSIWDGIHKLPPGHKLVYDSDGITIEQYWSLEDQIGEDSKGPDEVIHGIRSRLKKSVGERLISDVPLGFLLSGGVDSSLVTAIGHQFEGDRTAYSVAVGNEEDSEIEHARKVSDSIGINLQERNLETVDDVDLLKKTIYHYDEPLADTSIFPTMLLMEAISEDLTVALSGDGGDEFFVGYRWYAWYSYYRKLERFESLFDILNKAIEKLPPTARSGPISKLYRITAPFSERGWDRYNLVMDPRFTDQEIEDLLTESMNDGRSGSNPLDSSRRKNQRTKDLQYFDAITFLPGDILTKVDRASMANSVEVRVPFLDRSITSYSMSLSTESLVKNGELKWALKKLAREYVPNSIIDRKKQGFSVPFEDIPLVDISEELLSNSELSGNDVLCQEKIDETLKYGDEKKKFTLLMLELWYREWVLDQCELGIDNL